MTKVPLGMGLTPVDYINYNYWLLHYKVKHAWKRYEHCSAYVIEFENAEDAVAFKLAFDI